MMAELLAQTGEAFAAGRLEKTANLLVQAVRVDPAAADVFSNLAVVLEQLGQPEKALAACRRAVILAPQFPAAYYNMGISLSSMGRNDQAVAAYRHAIRLAPWDSEAFSNLGGALGDIGDLEGAVEACRRAIALDERIATAHANLGSVLRRQGQTAEAIAACLRAIELAPDLAKAHADLGAALIDADKPNDAIRSCKRALALDGGLLEACLFLGAAFSRLRRPHTAKRCCDYVLAHKPDYLEAVYNRAAAFQELGQPEEAITDCLRALALNEMHLETCNNLQLLLHYSPDFSLADIYRHAREFADRVEPKKISPVFSNPVDPARKLKIGYVSGDFCKHPVGFLLSPVLANHDHSRFEIFCYSNDGRRDEITERFQAMSDHWRSIWKRPDQDAADMIAKDGIDILVDLSGHTGMNRLPLFARKPAPVQVSWLGYWGTTGLSAMDYVLTDALTVPPAEDPWYSEKIVRLPGSRFCYAPPDYAPRPEEEPPVSRQGWITFGSFNNLAKLGAGVIGLWADVLRAVPDARLLLKWGALGDAAVRLRMVEAFGREGIAAERLILRSASPHAEMLAEYDDIDIALDPHPFSGGLTSCEALWMGVPVVTLPGDKAISRQTSGFLQVLGFSAWAAPTRDAYVETAQALASNVERLRELRRELRPRMATSALCDGPAYTKNVERALRTMWENWCATRRCGQ